MTELKIRARINMQGNILRLWLRYIAVRLLRAFSLFLSVFPVMSIFYSPSEVAGRVFGEYSAAFSVASAVFSALFLIFSFFAEYYYEASVCFQLDKNLPRPENCLSVRRVAGFIRLKLMREILKMLLLVFFFFPSLFLVYCTFSVALNGMLIRNNFYVLMSAGVFLFITGAVFYCVTCGRYYPAVYIYLGNPMVTAWNSLSSSVFLSRGKLMKLGICRLTLLPWHIFSVFGFTLPFSKVYCALIRAGLCEKIYGERKCVTEKSAVVFYIGKHSVMTSEENSVSGIS